MFCDYLNEPFFDFEFKKYICIDIHNHTESKDLNVIRQNVEEIKDTINSVQECDYVKTNIQTYPFSPNIPTRYSVSIKISSDIQSNFMRYLLKLINDSTESVNYERYDNGFIDISCDKTRILEILNSFV